MGLFISKKRALSIVEVVVAIGVSVITLTTSAIFSTRLIARAQENFMADSALQLTNIIVEQLRLVEADMQSKVTELKSSPNNSAFPPTLNSRETWNNICSTSNGRIYLTTNLPIVGNSYASSSNTVNINLAIVTGTETQTPYGDFVFQKVQLDRQTGAFFIYKESDLKVSISRTFERSNVLGDLLVFQIIASYKVPNLASVQYSNLVTVKMFRQAVCL